MERPPPPPHTHTHRQGMGEEVVCAVCSFSFSFAYSFSIAFACLHSLLLLCALRGAPSLLKRQAKRQAPSALGKKGWDAEGPGMRPVRVGLAGRLAGVAGGGGLWAVGLRRQTAQACVAAVIVVAAPWRRRARALARYIGWAAPHAGQVFTAWASAAWYAVPWRVAK